VPGCYSGGQMKKPELAKRMARRSGLSEAEAADRLDRVVNQILKKLRHGQEAPLPGLGKFRVGRDGKISFEQQARKADE
jgi:nucleoid DNA-binding protein